MFKYQQWQKTMAKNNGKKNNGQKKRCPKKQCGKKNSGKKRKLERKSENKNEIKQSKKLKFYLQNLRNFAIENSKIQKKDKKMTKK